MVPFLRNILCFALKQYTPHRKKAWAGLFGHEAGRSACTAKEPGLVYFNVELKYEASQIQKPTSARVGFSNP